MRELKFKRTEVLILDTWSQEKEDRFKNINNRFEGIVALKGDECKYYKVGDTILFEKKAPQVIPFEYGGVKYLIMDERSVICQVS